MLGPIALFDKSFLQSLSLDESVWFDHFHLPVVCPIFFIETLADLAKQQARAGTRTPEDEVRIIADKTPVLSGAPCVHHAQMCIANLMGWPSPRLGQVPLAGGRPVRNPDGKAGVVFKESPEAEAFSRWQSGQFQALERDIASSWRDMLANLDLREVASRMKKIGINPRTCKTVEDARNLAASLVHAPFEPKEQLTLLFEFAQIPGDLWGPIVQRWSEAGFPPLATHAGYAAHVLKVELFFQIALAANLISADRASNRADIAYLFYLPFCHVFISGDKLHRKCAPVFLSKHQDFVWGPDLKADLARINRHFLTVPELERQKGLHRLASYPPGEPGNLLVSLWDKHLPGARSKHDKEVSFGSESERKLVAHANSFIDAPTAPEVASLSPDDLESMTIQRLVPAQRGSWWLIPKEVADKEERFRDK